MNLTDFSWGLPQWLWALAVLPGAAGLFVWAEYRRRELLNRLVAARLQSVLAGNISAARRRLRFGLILAALACFIAVMAEPRYGYTFEEAKRKGSDVLIAIDTSRSMLATDLAPDRLQRAKLAAQDLIHTLDGDRVGLIAFAGSAFLQAPLTVDYSAVLSSLDELDTNVIPLGGTNIAEAIRIASQAFGKGEGDSRCLILFTDGEELDADAVAAARKAVKAMRIFTVGVGSADGSLIPVPGENGGTEFVRDSSGNFVKSRLDESKLKEIAEATGGFYIHLQNGPEEMHRIITQGLGSLREKEIDARMSRRPIERYQWPLGAGLLLMALSLFINERRAAAGVRTGKKGAKRQAAAILAGAVAFLPWNPAHAASESELYNQKRYEEARQQVESALKRRPDLPALRFNKGAVDYQLGDYNTAVNEFSKALASPDSSLRAKAEYNLGTALLQRALKRDEEKERRPREADLKNAIQHLDEALKLDPQQKDAEFNKQIAKKALEPKPTPPPQKKDQKKDDEKKDDQKRDDQKNQDQSKDQQSKDQQSKDQQSKDNHKGNEGGQKDQKDQKDQNKDRKDQKDRSGSGAPSPSPTPQNGNSGNDNANNGKDNNDPDSKHERPTGTPAPTPDDKKLSGDIKAQESDKKPDEKTGEEAQGAVEDKETPGEMSASQAKALLDSLKGEDDHPFKNERRSAAPVSKDW